MARALVFTIIGSLTMLFAQKATLISRAMVFAHPHSDPCDPANRYGFNHAANIAMLSDGRLMACWFSGPFEASVNQVVLCGYSSDEGSHWSKPEVFSDFPRRSDFDPAFLADGNRMWVFFSAGRWNRYPFVNEEKTNVGEISFQIYHRSTGDGGKTWSQTAEAAIERSFNCRNNGIRLRTGELLLPVAKLGRGQESGVLKSADAGKTWKRFGKIQSPRGEDEPTIVELNSGAVLMYLRTGGGTLWRTISKDKGETWSTPEDTGIVAARSSHSLFRLTDGRILLTHDASPNARTPLTMRISRDDAATWGEPLTIAEVPAWQPGSKDPRKQVSYPSIAQLRDGSVVAVYSDIVISDEVQYGDIRLVRVRIR
jgi:hypothetical protein